MNYTHLLFSCCETTLLSADLSSLQDYVCFVVQDCVSFNPVLGLIDSKEGLHRTAIVISMGLLFETKLLKGEDDIKVVD
ncbi:unnamed protein product [Lactuca virosa]|uniref:Uncharacterized protein n=1 Tax=Lactuca virosa TaxID=75947 RepID=A0AAU9ME82_9ASTR|nr:unnamed protein product [Lactuca virosa]